MKTSGSAIRVPAPGQPWNVATSVDGGTVTALPDGDQKGTVRQRDGFW